MFNKLTDKLKNGIANILPSKGTDYKSLYEAEVIRREDAEKLHRQLAIQMQHTLDGDKNNELVYIQKHRNLGL
jgi:hypothetical protein